MTLHAVLLTVGDVVGVLALLNFLFWAPLEKSWRECCLRAAVPVAIWSALRLVTIIIFREPFEAPMLGFFFAPPMAIGYAVVVRVIVQGGALGLEKSRTAGRGQGRPRTRTTSVKNASHLARLKLTHLRNLGRQPDKQRTHSMINRRHFLSKTAAAFAGVQILPRSVFGANEKLSIAFVGAGGKGWHAVQSLQNNDSVNFAAFADVHEARATESRKANPAVPFVSDFRKMLDQHGKSIDGVIISTPDHTHHFTAKTCMQAGKPVYLEKPLTHSIAEARDLMSLEQQTKLACQMGNQGHSGGGILVLEEWVKAGVLGNVNEAHCWAGPIWSYPDARPAEEPVPAGLDWNQWLGPSAMVPYSSKYLPAQWRGWFEFGNGTLGDWACHNMDAPYHVWGLDCPSRVEIESSGPSKLSFPARVKITYTFPASATRGEFKLHWYHGADHALKRPPELDAARTFPDGGTLIHGSKATVLMGTHAGTPRVIPEAKMQELSTSLPKVNLKRSNHWDNWLLAIKGQETCRSNFAYGGRLTETMHFGNIALHVNRSLTIDPATRSIIGDEEATALMHGPAAREGWKV